MLEAFYTKLKLEFKQASGTSRGILTDKISYFLNLKKDGQPIAIGECSVLKGLSIDDRDDYEDTLNQLCIQIHKKLSLSETKELMKKYDHFPSIQFGLEMAIQDLENKGNRILFPSQFTNGKASIPINGLIWMGDFKFMQKQIEEKLKNNFNCIKIKIGAINFEDELRLISKIRDTFSVDEVEIRVDANGAFPISEALEKLKRLADLQLHSIEQPIRQGNLQEMALLCEQTPLPIALDEELIGIVTKKEKEELLTTICPQYIILKPSLIGGFLKSEEWISLAEKYDVGWWITSALESNIGLNAIAQWTYLLNSTMPQGLGTGQLYSNNIESPLTIAGGYLRYDINKAWDLSNIVADRL